jgi:hypothetical protein
MIYLMSLRLFKESVQAGTTIIKVSSFPMFLYDESKYNCNNIHSSLFQGYLLLRFYRHVMTGPSSWKSGVPSSGKPGRGIANRLEAPTPRTIAYCYNMVRTPTLCKPDTSDRLYYFPFNLLNLATPLTTYAVRLVLLTFVPLLSLPCYLYDTVLILTSDILYSLIDTFLSILRYISTHVFVVEP